MTSRHVVLLILPLVHACGTAAPPTRVLERCSGASAGLSAAALSVDADRLTISDASAGNCPASALTMCFDRFLESNPVQVPIAVQAAASCSLTAGNQQATLVIDLSRLKATYLQAYQTTQGTIILSAGAASTDYRF